MLMAIERVDAESLQNHHIINCLAANNVLAVLISHSDTLLSAEHEARVLEKGRNATSLTASACPRKVDKHTPLQ